MYDGGDYAFNGDWCLNCIKLAYAAMKTTSRCVKIAIIRILKILLIINQVKGFIYEIEH